MTTILAVYNRALTALGERTIADVTEACEARRVLDALYADCVQFTLEQGMWNFAIRNTSVPGTAIPAMNYSYVFPKPVDLVHLFSASISSTYDPPLAIDFIDQGGSWWANNATLYVRYSSNDIVLGGANLTLWTQTFATYFAHTLAAWAALRITGSEQTAALLEQQAVRSHGRALSIDSVTQLPGMRPFNAEALAKPVEGHVRQPIEPTPFHAALGFVAGAGGSPQPSSSAPARE